MSTEKFVTYRDFSDIPREVFDGLSATYAQVFSESPWNETWSQNAVVEKLTREFGAEDSFLTVMRGDDSCFIGGFCWGAVVSVRDISDRVRAVREIAPGEMACLEAMVAKRRASRVLYVDELAIAPSFRSGIGAIASLCVPFFRIAVKKRVGALCWSTEESRISSILRAYRFKTIGEMGQIRFYWISQKTAQILQPVAEALAATPYQRK